MSATQLLWPLLEHPERDDCEPSDGGPCWLCASPWPRGQRVDKWNKKSFTGQSRVRCPESMFVCEPCVHTCSRITPVPGRPPKPGRKFGSNFRNYSQLYDAGEYTNASKGEKPVILEWLRKPKRGPWFCAIADSGQKHTLPWAPVNPSAGTVGLILFDETTLRLPEDLSIVEVMSTLLTAGATKEEIALGDYRAQTWMRCRAAIEASERVFATQRGGAWFGLALWLAQRNEEKVAVRMNAEKEAKKNGKTRRRGPRKAADKHGGVAADAARDVPRGVRRGRSDEALGAPSDANAEQCAARVKPGRVGNDDAQGPAVTVGDQGLLPGIG